MRWRVHFSPRLRVLLLALLLLAVVAALYSRSRQSDPSIVLLLPNEAALDLPVTQAWLDAAREEGLSVMPMTDDAFLRYGGDRQRIAGVILPDTVHPQASEMLINQLHRHVEAGGHLFMVFDAALLDSQTGRYAADQSRLSGLAGVRYAMYAELKDRTMALGRVYGSRESEQLLALQPGKMDFQDSDRLPLGELTTYGYARLEHGHFRTGPPTGAQALLVSDSNDVLVSVHPHGQGSVLFANLPLGYLKTRTDSYLLHRLLGHFADAMLQQPRLLAAPDGIGGLVLNLHVDSNAAQTPLAMLEANGWFRRGPFSLHVTAGPDAEREGDGLGLGINDNPAMAAFLRRMVKAGHEVGNHGGWNHNLFGKQADETNRDRFEPLLALNQASIGTATGQVPRSYSAPMGNQPQWATEWLQREGFKGYYFTGDNGLGPTRSYQRGVRAPRSDLWAFPVSSYHRVATFEELENAEPEVTPQDMTDYLRSLSRFVTDQHLVRLFYFHPPAAVQHLASIDALMAESSRLEQAGRFRWYTMEAMADFMSRREQVQWQPLPQASRTGGFSASSPAGLERLSWTVPAAGRGAPQVVQGNGSVRTAGDHWIVTAGTGQTLKVQWQIQ